MEAICRPSLMSSGVSHIAWIAENLRETWLDPVMIFFSRFGKTGAILFTVALAYWFWHKRQGKYLIYAMFGSQFLNMTLKDWIQECRPPSEYWLEHVGDSFSFPSGHAQVATMVWLGFACYVRSKWAKAICLFIALMIALARPYMGVHFPFDILVGTLLGIGTLSIFLLFEKKRYQPLAALPLWGQAILLGAALYLFATFIVPGNKITVSAVAGCFGFWLGCQWESNKLNFIPARSVRTISWQFMVGAAGLLVLWLGLGKLAYNDITTAIQYALLGWWIAFGAPAVFSRSNKQLKFSTKSGEMSVG